jgi:hypothetical protein
MNTRTEKINYLVEKALERESFEEMASIFRDGFKGYSEYTEEELTKAFYMQREAVLPQPLDSDEWNCGDVYCVIITVCNNKLVVVEDQDANTWEIDPIRLTLID